MTRSELYALVWQEPMMKLAKRFKLSDVGLRKICTKHGIPTARLMPDVFPTCDRSAAVVGVIREAPPSSCTADTCSIDRLAPQISAVPAFELLEARIADTMLAGGLASPPQCDGVALAGADGGNERLRPIGDLSKAAVSPLPAGAARP